MQAFHRISRRLTLAGLFCGLAATLLPAHAQDAAALRAHYDSTRSALDASPFKRPLTLQSEQRADLLQGDVYARIDQPFATARTQLQGTQHWCGILILHLNVKGCHAKGPNLALIVGRKFEQPESDGYRLEFAYRETSVADDYLQVQLDAGEGPLGTSDYRIVLETIPIDAKSSFLHMSYAYRYGTAARLAMQGYLATVGRDKVGFTVTGRGADGQPSYVDGVRGVLERNTMRYYLAIDAYLASTGLPAAQQLEKRLADWYDSNERYARQLHEMSRDEYLAMKRKETQAGDKGS
jgi:hypothetical protein